MPRQYLGAKFRAETEPPDISAVMGDVEELLNDSIATEGYRIGPASNPEALINLSEIDFDALQAKFAHGHKRTEAEKLKRLIEGKLAEMVKVNGSRIDLAERFQKMIDDYNAGSQNIEAFFKELKDFAQSLSAEEQRGVAEGLSEEELALFDILTKPEPVLTKAEEAEVKKACRDLLATLKREKLVAGLAGEAAGQGGGHADPQDGHATAAVEVHQGYPGREAGARVRTRL